MQRRGIDDGNEVCVQSRVGTLHAVVEVTADIMPGVVSLPGLQYRVLRSGPAEGRRPLRTDDVTVRYQGRFLDGLTPAEWPADPSSDPRCRRRNGAAPEREPAGGCSPG